MKKFLTAFLGLLLAPFLLFAAYNDVTMTTDAVVTIDSINLTVSGSSAEIEKIVVNDDNTFTVTLQSSSAITVSSTDRKFLGAEASGQVTMTRTCTSSASTLALSGASGVTVIVSIGGDCDASTTSSGGSGGGGGGAPGSVSTGGGGGGGGGSSSTPAPAAPATTPAPVVAQPSPVALLVSPVFNQTLKPGMTHADVKRLQELLNSDPDTRIADSGVGSLGNETDYYGSLTTKAVQKFQAKHGVVSSGSPDTTGYGLVGPATRQALILAFAGGVPAPSTSPTPVPSVPSAPATVSALFTGPLYNGLSHADVKRLQQLLNSDPDTRIAASGIGSPGNETDYFGSLTEQAVQKFQVKHGLAAPGDSGYGYVGPKTRAVLQSIFGEGSSMSPGATETTPTATPSSQSEEDKLQAQLDELNKQVNDLIKQLESAQ